MLSVRHTVAELRVDNPELKAEVYAALVAEVARDPALRLVRVSAGAGRVRQSVSENRPAHVRTKGHWRLESW